MSLWFAALRHLSITANANRSQTVSRQWIDFCEQLDGCKRKKKRSRDHLSNNLSFFLEGNSVPNMYPMDIFSGEVSFDGRALFEGDIVLDFRTRLLIQGGRVRRTRAVKKLATSRWPNGEIPYVVDRDLGKRNFNVLNYRLNNAPNSYILGNKNGHPFHNLGVNNSWILLQFCHIVRVLRLNELFESMTIASQPLKRTGMYYLSLYFPALQELTEPPYPTRQFMYKRLMGMWYFSFGFLDTLKNNLLKPSCLWLCI